MGLYPIIDSLHVKSQILVSTLVTNTKKTLMLSRFLALTVFLIGDKLGIHAPHTEETTGVKPNP